MEIQTKFKGNVFIPLLNNYSKEMNEEIDYIKEVLEFNDYNLIQHIQDGGLKYHTVIAPMALSGALEKIIMRDNPKVHWFNDLSDVKRINDYICNMDNEYNELELYDPKYMGCGFIY